MRTAPFRNMKERDCRIHALAALLPSTGDSEAGSNGISTLEFCTRVRCGHIRD